MKQKTAVFCFANASDLVRELTNRFSGKELATMYVEDKVGTIDRLEVIEETLSDKSVVRNIRLVAATRAQRKREAE